MLGNPTLDRGLGKNPIRDGEWMQSPLHDPAQDDMRRKKSTDGPDDDVPIVYFISALPQTRRSAEIKSIHTPVRTGISLSLLSLSLSRSVGTQTQFSLEGISLILPVA